MITSGRFLVGNIIKVYPIWQIVCIRLFLAKKKIIRGLVIKVVSYKVIPGNFSFPLLVVVNFTILSSICSRVM